MPETAHACTQAIYQSSDSPVLVAPGLWDEGADEGIIMVRSEDPFDITIEPGTKIAEIHPSVTQTRVCQDCGWADTDSWPYQDGLASCNQCGSVPVHHYLAKACSNCHSEGSAILSYTGCAHCRPEGRLLWEDRGEKVTIKQGPAKHLLQKAARAAAMLVLVNGTCVSSASASLEPSQPEPTATASPGPSSPVRYTPVFHIVEEPGGIRRLTECEVPTEEFNAARTADMAARYPNLSPGLLEHLDALEPFLNTSIIAGSVMESAKPK